MTIREARIGDAPKLAELATQLGYPTAGIELARRLEPLLNEREDHLVLVAADARDRAIGWLHACMRRGLQTDPYVEVVGLVVDATCRSAGSGAELLRAAERWAATRGAVVVRVRSNVTRERTHRFYLRHGYAVSKTAHVFDKLARDTLHSLETATTTRPEGAIMDDYEDSIAEELQIQDESVRPPSVLSADTFMQPISAMCREQKLVTLAPSAPIADAISRMQERRIGAVLVVVEDKVVGIVTERDVLMKVVNGGLDVAREPVEKIMTRDPETLMMSDQLAYLLNTMRVGGFRHVPIVDDRGRPLHLISLRDVLAYIVDHFPQEILNIPSQPFRGTPSQYGG